MDEKKWKISGTEGAMVADLFYDECLFLSPLWELRARLNDSSADEDLTEIYLQQYFGTHDRLSVHLENPQTFELRIFPDEIFYNKMVRFRMLQTSKIVWSCSAWFYLIFLF